jgi:hypothetical protein
MALQAGGRVAGRLREALGGLPFVVESKQHGRAW